MKFVAALPDTDRKALEKLHHDGKSHRQRQRAQAVLLSSKGFTLEQLAVICEADPDTVSACMDAWQKKA